MSPARERQAKGTRDLIPLYRTSTQPQSSIKRLNAPLVLGRLLLGLDLGGLLLGDAGALALNHTSQITGNMSAYSSNLHTLL